MKLLGSSFTSRIIQDTYRTRNSKNTINIDRIYSINRKKKKMNLKSFKNKSLNIKSLKNKNSQINNSNNKKIFLNTYNGYFGIK